MNSKSYSYKELNDALDGDPFDSELLNKMEDQNKSILSDSKSINNVCRGRKDSLTSFNSSISSVEDVKPLNKFGSVTSKLSSLLNLGSNEITLDQYGTDSRQKWQHIIDNWEQFKKKRNLIQSHLITGIPDDKRCQAWPLYSLAYERTFKIIYPDLLKQNSPFEKQIQRDICRTYPNHDYFKEKNGPGQTSLFNVMKAYSLFDAEVGYCQGSAFIAGILLLKLQEEDAFKVLVQMMHEYRMRELYKPSMTELGICMHQMEGLVNDFLPDLQLHFISNSFAPSLYASAWFLTLFATSCSLDFVKRVIDIFFAEGMNIIFKISLGILKVNESTMLSMDMESMVNLLQHDLMSQTQSDFQSILDTALQFKLNPKRMKKLEKEYLDIQGQERYEQTELRRLKSENSLLKHRLARLEDENSRVTDELVQSQIARANEAETILSLKNKLSRLNTLFSDEQNESIILNKSNATSNMANSNALSSNQNSSMSSFTSFDSDKKKVKLETNGLQGKELPEPIDVDQTEEKQTNGVSHKTEEATSSDQMNSRLVATLQEDLVRIRTREAQLNHEYQETKFKLANLQEKYDLDLKDQEIRIACLEDKLLTVKLHEADAVLHLDDSRKRLSELECLWRSISQGRGHQEIADNLNRMSGKISEATLSLRIQELEREIVDAHSKNEYSQHQVTRKEEQIEIMKDKLESSKLDQKELMKELRNTQCEAADIEANETPCDDKRRNENIMWRLREMELLTQLAEQKQLFSQLETKYQAALASDLINNCPDQTNDMQTPKMSHESFAKKHDGQITPDNKIENSMSINL